MTFPLSPRGPRIPTEFKDPRSSEALPSSEHSPDSLELAMENFSKAKKALEDRRRAVKCMTEIRNFFGTVQSTIKSGSEDQYQMLASRYAVLGGKYDIKLKAIEILLNQHREYGKSAEDKLQEDVVLAVSADTLATLQLFDKLEKGANS